VRNTGEIFEFINDIKKFFNNINSFIPIYFNIDIRIRDIEFSEKYKIFIKRADRKTVTDRKSFTRP
jgi:hypothetical protein